MKKILVTILAAACVLSLCACPANVKPETSIEETTAVTTEETETETTAEITAETTATDPADTSSTEETTSTAPETTPVVTPTVTPAPKATVTSQVKKTFKKDGTNYKYEIPKVTIPGKNTSAVNKKIKKALSKYSYKGSEPYAMKYTYYVNSKIVSILVNVYNTVIDSDYEYYAYNISVKTGKLIKDKEVLKLYGVSSKKFLSMVKSTYKKGGYWAGKGSEAKKNIKKSLKKVSYKYLDPYVGSNGHICFLGYVYYSGGAGEGYIPFDAVKKKQVNG